MAGLFLTALVFGVLEGVTEWLPISSTGHLLLLESFFDFGFDPAFYSLFEVFIQLGAILAVPVLFFEKLNPVSRRKSKEERHATLLLWGKVLLAVLPSAVAGLWLDDWIDAHLHNAATVAAALILYGLLFLAVGRFTRRCTVEDATAVTWRQALAVGAFQVLSLIPGTSRSGATILGGLLLGLSRTAAAELSFFLGIPTMAGAGLLRGVKFFLSGGVLTGAEWLLLLLGALIAFLVSLAVIEFLLDFVRRHSFAGFGVYRIVLGALVLLLPIIF